MATFCISFVLSLLCAELVTTVLGKVSWLLAACSLSGIDGDAKNDRDELCDNYVVDL